MNKKHLKNNKGFSLVELLIVIAIMGVLAVLAFNVFGNVLSNSKRKADDQQAQNIAKAVLTYCADADDWDLTKGGLDGLTGSAAIAALTVPIDIDGVKYGPYVALKDATGVASDAVNAAALAPQYNASAGGTNVGWQITVSQVAQNVTCTPAATDATVVVN